MQQRLKYSMELFSACARGPSDYYGYHAAEAAIAGGADVNHKCGVLDLHFQQSIFVNSSESVLTPMFVACYHGNIRVAKLLLDSGADDERALFAAAERGSFPATEGILFPDMKSNIELVEFLLERGFEVNFRTQSSKTVLYAAVQSGCVDVVELLIKNGAEVNDGECPPLLAVSRMPFFDAYEGLDLSDVDDDDEYGSDDDDDYDEDYDEDYDDDDPRGTAAADMTKLLLRYGADPDIRDDEGVSLFEMAIQMGNAEVANVLLEHQRQRLPSYEGVKQEVDNDDEDQDDEGDGDCRGHGVEGYEEDKGGKGDEADEDDDRDEDDKDD